MDCSPLVDILNKNAGRDIDNNSICSGQHFGHILKGKFENIVDLFAVSDKPAFIDPTGSHKYLSHRELYKFISTRFDLKQFGIPIGSRVAVSLPNGPELAISIIALISKWCAVPINLNNSYKESYSELKSTKAVAVIILG